MKRWNDETYEAQAPCAVALGNFDGVHRGHAQIIKTMNELARAEGLLSLVWTFSEHPENVMSRERGECPAPLITSNSMKYELMEGLGVGNYVSAPFRPELAELSPAEFVDRILVDKLQAKVAVCGFNYHFGHLGQGSSADLQALCAARGIRTAVVEPVTQAGVVVSSTQIRKLILEGNMEAANALLGHPYRIELEVLNGQRLARKLGFPTINQHFFQGSIVPAHGVYVTVAETEGRRFGGVTNVGTRPTVGGKKLTAETHLFDFEGNLYGKTIQVDFLKMLRGEHKFDTALHLAAQVAQDIQEATLYFARSEGAAESKEAAFGRAAAGK